MERTQEIQKKATAAAEAARQRPVYLPATDIVETEDAIIVTAEMPGVAPDAADVTLENGLLTIRGHTAAPEHPGYRQVYAEYAAGDFERVFTLSEDIDDAGIQASQKDGVLTLVLPKAGPAKPRRIEVKAAP